MEHVVGLESKDHRVRLEDNGIEVGVSFTKNSLRKYSNLGLRLSDLTYP
jgi:hypothetical protein